eukprot:1554057-Pleurochrysis_carterae.AAC.1
MAASLDDILTPCGELSIGGIDYNTASWSIRSMASSILSASAAFKKLRALDAINPFLATRRIQLQFYDMSWDRGHGCTRMIVRTPDLLG